MPDIVLAAFNARYAHTSFGARYLLANLGELKEQAELLEFDIAVQPRVAVEQILAHNPRIVGIGCYIWNIELATKVAALIKCIRPEIKTILGGPETSYETEQQEIFQYADHVICGEGEVEFRKLCSTLLGRRAACGTAFVSQAA
ncbi:MAG: cobalamin-dependent protein, partial [Verrucomicrobiota bacterium]|nr:cobalamin-dependent protein [Verrucomicrobiota bacterium]